MKKLLCALMALALLCSLALAEGGVRIAFEDGFSLELPAGWMHYAPNEEMTAEGVLYCLSDAEGKNWMYVQSWVSELTGIEALHEQIIAESSPQTSGVYTFNGTPFVVYDLAEGDVSCCAALLEGKVVNFIFTPQSDSAYMMTAAQIMDSFFLI